MILMNFGSISKPSLPPVSELSVEVGALAGASSASTRHGRTIDSQPDGGSVLIPPQNNQTLRLLSAEGQGNPTQPSQALSPQTNYEPILHKFPQKTGGSTTHTRYLNHPRQSTHLTQIINILHIINFKLLAIVLPLILIHQVAQINIHPDPVIQLLRLDSIFAKEPPGRPPKNTTQNHSWEYHTGSFSQDVPPIV